MNTWCMTNPFDENDPDWRPCPVVCDDEFDVAHDQADGSRREV